MLAESLVVSGISCVRENTVGNLNLLRRGFRHIPPIGFLPIDPDVAGGLASNINPSTGNDRLDAILKKGGALAGLVSGYVEGASRVAESYFNGTNVITYTVVALHDDDILEDFSNLFDKDPIQLASPLKVLAPRTQPIKQASGLASASGSLLTILLRLATLLPEYGLADLVNRRVEIVKLIVPLQGLTRSHPILGTVAEDAQDQLPDWGIAQTGAGAGAFTLGGLRDRIALDMLPRHFVVYARQRMVLLDAIFELLELLELLVKIFPQLVSGNNAKDAFVSTDAMRTAYQAMPVQRRALAQATLAHPSVQFALSRVVPLAAPDLAVSTRITTFEAQVDAQDTALQATVKDATQRRQMALDRVANSYAAVYPGYQFVQLLAATQAPADAEQAVLAIGDGAGALGSLSLAPSATAEDASLAQGIPVFDTPEAAQLFAQLRTANAEKPVSSLVQGVTTTATVGQILALSPAEATQLLGGAQNYATFKDAYAGATKTAAGSVTTVIKPPAGLADKLQAALGQSGGDLAKALQSVRSASGTDAATQRYHRPGVNGGDHAWVGAHEHPLHRADAESVAAVRWPRSAFGGSRTGWSRRMWNPRGQPPRCWTRRCIAFPRCSIRCWRGRRRWPACRPMPPWRCAGWRYGCRSRQEPDRLAEDWAAAIASTLAEAFRVAMATPPLPVGLHGVAAGTGGTQPPIGDDWLRRPTATMPLTLAVFADAWKAEAAILGYLAADLTLPWWAESLLSGSPDAARIVGEWIERDPARAAVYLLDLLREVSLAERLRPEAARRLAGRLLQRWQWRCLRSTRGATAGNQLRHGWAEFWARVPVPLAERIGSVPADRRALFSLAALMVHAPAVTPVLGSARDIALSGSGKP